MTERETTLDLWVLQHRVGWSSKWEDLYYYTAESDARDGYSVACQERSDVRLIKRTTTQEVL